MCVSRPIYLEPQKRSELRSNFATDDQTHITSDDDGRTTTDGRRRTTTDGRRRTDDDDGRRGTDGDDGRRRTDDDGRTRTTDARRTDDGRQTHILLTLFIQAIYIHILEVGGQIICYLLSLGHCFYKPIKSFRSYVRVSRDKTYHYASQGAQRSQSVARG